MTERSTPAVEAFRLVFRQQHVLRIDGLVDDLLSLRSLLAVGIIHGMIRQIDSIPASELEPRWILKQIEGTVHEIDNVNIERISYNSPLEFTLSAIAVGGWGGVAVYSLRHVVDLVERWSEMRVRLAKNRYKRQAVKLLEDDLLKDIDKAALRKLVQQYVLQNNPTVNLAADSLIQIESAVAVSGSDSD